MFATDINYKVCKKRYRKAEMRFRFGQCSLAIAQCPCCSKPAAQRASGVLELRITNHPTYQSVTKPGGRRNTPRKSEKCVNAVQNIRENNIWLMSIKSATNSVFYFNTAGQLLLRLNILL